MRRLAIVVTFAAFGLAALLLGSEGARGEESGGAAAAAPLRVYDPGDGGPIYLGDPPGELRPSNDPPPPARAAEPADAGSAQSEEVRQLRARLAALEQRFARSRNDGNDVQSELLWQLNEQLADVRHQLVQA